MPNLTCGTDHTFRVSAKGDGTTYSSFVYGGTSAEVTASTTIKCTPQNLSVTPLAQRRAKLSWDKVDNVASANSYVVRVSAFDPATTTPAYRDLPSTTDPFHVIDLDSILPTGEGLAHAPYAYQFVVQASVEVPPGGMTMPFTSAPIVIIDTPILSANGSSVGAAMNGGKAALKWTRVETVLKDTDYEDGHYSFRYRKFTNFEGHPHTMIGWQPGKPMVPAQPGQPAEPEVENFEASEYRANVRWGRRDNRYGVHHRPSQYQRLDAL